MAGGAQQVAGGKGVGVGPGAGGLVPEPVTGRGLDDRGPAVNFDSQVIQGDVMLEDDGPDGLGLRLPGLDVGGEDLVAGLELADRDGRTGGEQDFRGRREAVITARVDVVPVRAGVGEVAAGVLCG